MDAVTRLEGMKKFLETVAENATLNDTQKTMIECVVIIGYLGHTDQSDDKELELARFDEFIESAHMLGEGVKDLLVKMYERRVALGYDDEADVNLILVSDGPEEPQ